MHGRIRRVEDLGRTVREVRRRRGMTQAELAAALGVAQSWLSELETGKTKVFNDALLATLAGLGIRLSVEVDDDDD